MSLISFRSDPVIKLFSINYLCVSKNFVPCKRSNLSQLKLNSYFYIALLSFTLFNLVILV
ncbi:hypothetical protein RhiirA5_425790 [Rhizophagus irregularis]|uniref:Uncharacterized protein n=1 Tax=Rhizophagus irregularis TaxID=588596 RepID=A0A2N0P5G3_9GLOM|nr:hypothetical protein RhiirA5_425790 [Rhizophagus irregularis]